LGPKWLIGNKHSLGHIVSENNSRYVSVAHIVRLESPGP